MGRPVQGTIDLGGPVRVQARFEGSVDEVAVTEVAAADSAGLTGELQPVVDALAGRGRPLCEVLGGPTEIVQSLALLGSAI